MSSSPRANQKAEDGQENVVFPPLMNTLDTYMDASSDIRYSQIVDKVKANKKKVVKKVKKKSPSNTPTINSNVIHMEPIDHILLRPESRIPSQESPRSQYRLRHYSAGEREDFQFDSLSLESSQHKVGGDLGRKMLVSSPPLSDRKAGKSNYTPKSPARILVQPGGAHATGGGYLNQHSPPEGHHVAYSPGSQIVKSDLGFGKAVESIAAIKLHNYAMKRRDHVSQKLKLLKEIRSFERENNAELIEARKLRKDEMLAAWKLRYYIEYLRLNTVRHVVDVVEGKNQELEEECSLLQQSSAVAEIENESLTKEISRLSDHNNVLQERNAELDTRVQDLQMKVESSLRMVEGTESASHQAKELILQSRQALQQEAEQGALLRNELQMTRLTCQDLVRTSVAKDTQLVDMSAELVQLRALHKIEQQQILAAQETHLQEMENARMREEDNEIRLHKAANLHTVLNDREKTIRHYESEVIAMGKEIVALKAQIEASDKLVSQEKDVIAGIDQEKAGLQKLLAELAKRLTQADEEAIKHKVVERQHKADAKTAQGVINTHLSTIQGLEDQGAAAHAEIEFLVEENHELAREIECHHMYGEEMMQRYLTTFSAAERHLEYSRFLEEELFCARKLYEKSSTQYNGESKGRRGSVGAGAGNSVSDMFGDMSEESYVYRNSFKNNQETEGEYPQHERRHSTGSRSAIENFTGLEPVPPMILHLNSFSKGAPRRSRPGDFERPNSASLYNPDSRPHSTGGPNNSMVAEQRFMMILSQLEDKMRSVDRAADSLRFLAEKADAIEKVQNTTANILQSHATAEAMARQPVRLSVQMQAMSAQNVKAMEDKTSRIDRHINMERVFSEMHASLDQVNADLIAQEQEVTRLQARRAECKETISGMKKRIKKSRKASVKESSLLLTEAEEAATETEMSQLSDEMEGLKERINACKADNLNLNSKSIALQTELYHLDQDLERSANEFLATYGEHITAYYPAELAHLIENNDGHEEHGHYSPPPAGGSNNMHLNTLYEDDEWSESVVNAGGSAEGGSTEGNSLVNTPGPPTSDQGTTHMQGGAGLENSVEFVGGDSSSMDEVSEMESPDFNSPYSPAGGSRSRKSERKKSKFSNDEPYEKSRKSSKMGKLSRKFSKSPVSKSNGKSSKKHRSKSSFDGDSVEGSGYEFASAHDLEEGSSGIIDEFGVPEKDESQLIPAPSVTADLGFSPQEVTGRKRFDSDNTLSGQGVYAKSNESLGSLVTPAKAAGAPNDNAGLNTGGSNGGSIVSAVKGGGSRVSPGGSRVLQGDYSTDRQARLQSQMARERLSHLRGDLEHVIAELDPALDVVEQLEGARHNLRAEIVRWVENFTALCGYVPERSDRIRSVTLQPWVTQFAAVQADLQMAHSKVVAIASSALALRTALAKEQYQLVSGLSTEQLDEQLRLLYPIVDLGELVLEDPFDISANSNANPHFVDSVSELSSMYQSMELAPHEGVSGVHYSQQRAVPSVVSAPMGAPAAAHPVVSAATASPAIDTPPKRYVVKTDSFSGLPESLTADENDDVDSIVTTDSPKTGGRKAKKSKKEKERKKGKSTKERSLELDKQPEEVSVPAQEAAVLPESEASKTGAAARNAAASTAPVRVPYRETITDGTYSFPTTPFTDKIAGLNYEQQSLNTDVSFRMPKFTNWEGMFAPPGEVSVEAMTAENKKLRKELRIWTSDFVKLYGRKPIPSDFDSFDDIIKAKLFRKNQLSVLLGETDKSTVDGHELESDAETSAAGNSKQGLRPKHIVPTKPGSGGNAAGIRVGSAGGDGTFSVPTTPFGDRLQSGAGAGAANADFSMRFSKSTKWAGMFAETGEETPEMLLAEQQQLKTDLRDWAAAYYHKHGHKPSPDDYDSFDVEIKKKLFRKDQIKAILMQQSQSDFSHGQSVDDVQLTLAKTKAPLDTREKSPVRVMDFNLASEKPTGYSLPGTPYGAPIARLDSSIELAAQLQGGEVSIEDLLQEQATLRNDIRVWTQDYVALYGRKPNVEDFTGLDLDIKAKLVRKNQIKKLLAQHGVVTAASRKYDSKGDSLELDSISSDLTPKSAGNNSRPSAPAAVVGAEEPAGAKKAVPAGTSNGEPTKPTPVAAPVSVPALVAVPTSVETPAPPAVEVDAIETAEVVDAPTDASDAEMSPGKHRKSKRADSPGKSERRASPSSKKYRKSKSCRPSSRGADSGSESDVPERTGTAQSDGFYSMPTTPYVSNFGGLDSTDNSVNDVSIKISSTKWEGLNMASAARNIAESIDESPEHLNEELNQLKRELRKWNASFMKKHGRMPGADDFADFDEEIKVKLFRKNQIKKLLDEAERGGGEVVDEAYAGAAAVAAASADTQHHIEGRMTPQETAESKHRRGGGNSPRSKPKPVVAVSGAEEEREVSAEVFAKGAQPRISSSESAEGSALADTDSLDPAVAEVSKELASIKQSLKMWQRLFVERTGREPQQNDLTAEVLAMGERRDELKRFLVHHKRSDLVSAKTCLFSPTLTPSPESPPAPSRSAATPSRPKGSADGAERLTSPKSKRVSFVSREAAAPVEDEFDFPDQPPTSAVNSAAAQVSAALGAPPVASKAVSVMDLPPSISTAEETQETTQEPRQDSTQESRHDTRQATPEKVEYTLEQLEVLDKEYSKIKKALKKWQKEFVETHDREPGDEDFDQVDDAFKEMIVRKYELKEILGDESVQASLVSSKSKKTKKGKSKDV